ncbi:MAG: DUF459 domain-containing protein, partial [Deltaproteobacteria bacterium]|nr:DUF459 domain-containing protein [Deltaproteobacteria bacterium]
FKYFKDLLAENKPQLVFITLGANDTQDIVDEDRKRHIVTTPSWNEHYGNRVAKILEIARESDANVLWIGLPVMGQEPYNTRAANINAVASQTCLQASNCRFWDSTKSLTNDKGAYSTYLTKDDGQHVRVREKDSIHLTRAGGEIMLQDFLDGTSEWVLFTSPQNADQLTAPSAGSPDGNENEQAILLSQNQTDANIHIDGNVQTNQPDPFAGGLTAEDLNLPTDSPNLNLPQDALSFPVATDFPDAQQTPAVIEPQSGDSEFDIPQTLQSQTQDQTQTQTQTQDQPQTQTQDQTRQPSAAAEITEQQQPDQQQQDVAQDSIAQPQSDNPPFALTETVLVSASRGITRYLAAAPPISDDPNQPKLPAVLLLHGAEGDQNFFPKGIGTDDLTALASQYGIILIMPDGLPFGWYLDSPLVPENQVASYITQELLPDVLSRFQVDPNRLGILGISMGGHGALTLAINNPGRFKAISTLSAVIDLESHQTESTLDKYLKVSDLLGPPKENLELWQNHSAYFLTRQTPQALNNVALRLTIGLSDKLCLAENRQYNRLLTDLGIEHQYLEQSGGHGWKLWKPVFPANLQFFSQHL